MIKFTESNKPKILTTGFPLLEKEKKDEKDGLISIDQSRDNQSSIQQNKSLLVLEDEGDFNRSNFNLFRFIMTINFLIIVLIGLIVYIKDIPIKDIISIF